MFYYGFITLLFLAIANCDNNDDYAIHTDHLLVEDPPGSEHYVSQNLSDPPDTTLSMNDDNVLLYLYTREINGTLVNSRNISSVNFDVSKETVVVIHGWMVSSNDTMAQTVKDAYLDSRDVNVLVVDWSDTASRLYVTARFYISDVAQVVSNCLWLMVNTIGLDLNKTALVGHSLGAHVAGIIGANLDNSVNHIVGLDPAGPLFRLAQSTDKLDPTDAQFVEVIHTNAGLLGYPNALGDSDYWPNGGSYQSGCGLDATGRCSHARSYEYYSESLISGGFRSLSCGSYIVYLLSFCNGNQVAYMGNDALDRSEGNFYLRTNSQPPYSQS